jgi:hypothetical protein
MSRYLAILVLILGVVGMVVGSVFIAQAIEKDNWMREAMRVEQVTLSLSDEQIAAGQVIDSLEEAQIAGDTIREHRRNIAPTYEDLLGGGRYDPTDPKQLSYAQALNMENYLYLAVLGFGVTTVIIGTGVFMVITGFALGVTGVVLFRLSGRIA